MIIESRENPVASLGAGVREARRRRGMTQAELAQAAKVSRAFVIELERGHRRAEVGKVFAVLAALGQDVTITPLVPSAQQLSIEERAHALADVIEDWSQGRALPDDETQRIVHAYIRGALSIDEAIDQIDALPALVPKE